MKKNRRRDALKKEQRNRKIRLAVIFALAFAVVASVVIYNVAKFYEGRIYVAENARIILSRDGTFDARLFHEDIAGTYEESGNRNSSIVTFFANDIVTQGHISNNALSIPPEWDDGLHGHPTIFFLR